MYTRGEKDLADATVAAGMASSPGAALPLNPRPLALWPSVSDLAVQMYRLGRADVLKIDWKGVALRAAALNGQAITLPGAAAGEPVLVSSPRINSLAYLSLTGVPASGQPVHHQVRIDPTATFDHCGLARLTLSETRVPGGVKVTPVLAILTKPDANVPQPPMASLLGLKLGRRRPGHPVLTRPLAAFLPDVAGVILGVSQTLSILEDDGRQTFGPDEPTREWLLDQLLTHPSAPPIADVHVMSSLLDTIDAVRRDAGADLSRLHQCHGPARAQTAQTAWTHAFAQLVALRLPIHVLSSPILLSNQPRVTLNPFTLGEGDGFVLQDLPGNMRLEIQLRQGEPRDFGLALPEVRNGSLVWPDWLDKQDRSHLEALRQAPCPPRPARVASTIVKREATPDWMFSAPDIRAEVEIHQALWCLQALLARQRAVSTAITSDTAVWLALLEVFEAFGLGRRDNTGRLLGAAPYLIPPAKFALRAPNAGVIQARPPFPFVGSNVWEGIA